MTGGLFLKAFSLSVYEYLDYCKEENRIEKIKGKYGARIYKMAELVAKEAFIDKKTSTEKFIKHVKKTYIDNGLIDDIGIMFYRFQREIALQKFK